MDDTSLEIAEYVRKRYRDMTPLERLRIGAEMFDSARAMVLASFPPDLTELERRRLLSRRLYGSLFDAAFQSE